MQYIKKRKGNIVKFDELKIENAIFAAAQSVGGTDRSISNELTKIVIERVEEKYKDSIPTVEDIQDIVEKVLMEKGYYSTAKSYILYRDLHNKTRNVRNLVDSNEIMDSYLNRSDWRVKENSNQAYSLPGLNYHVATTITANYWLNNIYDKEVRDAHINAYMHIHDLGIFATYCVGWNLEDLITKGYGGVSFKNESKPPKHLRSLLGQITNFFFTLQGESAGAQAFSDFDVLLAPYVKEDNLSYQEVKQSLQEFIYSINVPTRSGFQAPFTNITLDLVIPKTYENRPVMIGNELRNYTYGECQKEVNMINTALGEIFYDGDAKGKPFSFPIPTINLTKTFNWENPALEVWWKLTAKYGTPYFGNYINSDMDPDQTTSMCCRLKIDRNEIQKRGGGLFSASSLTGSVGVVTLNLPIIAYEAKHDKNLFYEILDKYMILAKISLENKRNVLEKFTEDGLYPYSKYYLEEVKKRNKRYWANHFSTIGLCGMNEACLNFIGKDITTPEGKAFGLEVMNYMREKVFSFQKETKNLYNLEATPAESTGYRFARVMKKKYPDAITQGTKEFPYITNSTQAPVNWTNDLYEYMEHQDDFQVLYTGGTVVHVYLGEHISDWSACRGLVKKIAENFKLPYFSITPVFSMCQKHGYIPGAHKYCKYCDEDIRKKIEVK